METHRPNGKMKKRTRTSGRYVRCSKRKSINLKYVQINPTMVCRFSIFDSIAIVPSDMHHIRCGDLFRRALANNKRSFNQHIVTHSCIQYKANLSGYAFFCCLCTISTFHFSIKSIIVISMAWCFIIRWLAG